MIWSPVSFQISTFSFILFLSTRKQPNGQSARIEPRMANSIQSHTMNLSAAGPSHFQRKAVQWPFYQDRKPKREPSERWPASGHFYQRGNSQMARALDLSRGLRIPYDPTQRIYQRPGQAIFNQKRPNGHFLSRQKRSNGQIPRLEPRMAQWPFRRDRKPKRGSFRALASQWLFLSTRKQPNGQSPRIEPRMANSI